MIYAWKKLVYYRICHKSKCASNIQPQCTERWQHCLVSALSNYFLSKALCKPAYQPYQPNQAGKSPYLSSPLLLVLKRCSSNLHFCVLVSSHHNRFNKCSTYYMSYGHFSQEPLKGMQGKEVHIYKQTKKAMRMSHDPFLHCDTAPSQRGMAESGPRWPLHKKHLCS